MSHKVVITVGLVLIAALAYGYWHGSSHGTLYVSALDVSDRQRPRPINDAELRFLDSAGKELAQARAEGPYGVVYLTQPALYSCHEIEKQAIPSSQSREAWGICFERQSRWLITWAREVRYIDMQSGVCRLQKIPVAVSEYADDWWIWWLPLPHAGGKPYTSFSMSITVNLERCAIDSGHS